jgi:hypothetical protein
MAHPKSEDNQLLIYYQYDLSLKVYALDEGLQNPRLLWKSPGAGMGPGEIPKGALVNNIAVDREKSRVWVSHRNGYVIFDKNGAFVRNIKVPYSESRIIVEGNQLWSTSYEPLRDRTLIRSVVLGSKQPRWSMPFYQGIPFNEKGSIVREDPELARFEQTFYCYDAILGDLYAVNPGGSLQYYVNIPQQVHPNLIPIKYKDSIDYKSGFSLSSLPNSDSGLAIDGTQLHLVRKRIGKRVSLESGVFVLNEKEVVSYRTLMTLNRENGEILGEHFHEVFAKIVLLVGKRDNSFLLFNMESGDRFYQVRKLDRVIKH